MTHRSCPFFSTTCLNILTALASRTARFAYVDTAATGCSIVLGSIDNSFLDVSGQAVKSLVDVDVALSGNFEEGNTEFVG